jgi:putative dimethyl sulfoxide reductase chaperone
MLEAMSREELAGRASVYRLLAQLYRKEMTAPMAKALDQSRLLDLFETGGYEHDEGPLLSEERLTELRREFCRVFLGPGPHVSPYGSVHHPDDPKVGRLWGDTTKEIHRFAKDHDLELKGPGYDGIPDHVGHELEMLALLIEAEAEAGHQGDEERAERLQNSQRYLLAAHLGRWVPPFCEKVRSKAIGGFYRSMAALTIDLLEDDQGRLTATEEQPAS